MVNYNNGKIYKIIDNTTDNFYLGSTAYPELYQRLDKHRGYRKEFLKTGKKFITSKIILDNEDYKIILLELFPCGSRDELRAQEQSWMDNLRCENMVNKYNAKGPNLEKNKITSKKYYDNNKDEIIEKQKIYRDAHKEEMVEYSKTYRDTHKNEIKEQQKLYRYNNKIQCDRCKSIVQPQYYKKHQLTKSCINALPNGIINKLDDD